MRSMLPATPVIVRNIIAIVIILHTLVSLSIPTSIRNTYRGRGTQRRTGLVR